MTTPTTGLKLSNIQSEFGGTNPVSLSEYYRGGAYVSSGQSTSVTDGTPVPSSGTIRMGMFRGLTSIFSFSPVISASTANYNLRTAALAAGWNGVSPINATVTINSGVFVYSTTTATAAFDTGTLPAGSSVSITNNGFILGAGGSGGTGSTVPNAAVNSFGAATPGSAGGVALRVLYSATITNNGVVGGGGGGGGGGGAAKTDWTHTQDPAYMWGAPGAGGGGGRGGVDLLACGLGGAGSTAVGCAHNLTSGPGGTTASNTTGAGTGGAGGARAVQGSTIGAGAGGLGGGWGLPGATGDNPDTSNPDYVNCGWSVGATGGAAGACSATLPGQTLTWAVAGTRYGAVA